MAGERILIADDEPDVLAVATRALVQGGYEVTGVPSGVAAVEEAQRHNYDMLIADVKMPGMSGLRAYRLIKEAAPDTIGLIITGYGTMEMAIEAVRLGVNAFILKPFGPDELRATVARALEGRRLARENARLRALLPVHELSRTLVATTDLERLTTQVASLAARETGASFCSLLLLDDEAQELYLAATSGAGSKATRRLKLGEGIAGWVAKTGETMALQGALAEDGAVVCAGEGASSVCLPLLAQGRAIGVISLVKAAGAPPFTEADTDLLTILAGGAAAAIANAQLFTHLQRAYERLAELDHRKSEFISLAAHELRSPLAAVITYATLIEGDLSDEARDHLHVILEAAMRLNLLLDDLLNLRNLDTGTAVLHPEPVALDAATGQALGALVHLAQAKEQQVSLALPPELPQVFADPQKLQIILLNLLSNAIKFTPNGGLITVEALPDRSQVVVSVRDSGIGIPDGERERIFERFYQVADSLRREQGGLGLGLSIVKGMVEMHGGRIWVESQPGRGSTFSFSLPKWQSPAGA
ncbi:MAG TPA: ATP-binding protein [Anaerolineae bacterium]|nr:ATP-binding protein [Anaerolineae bacterium]HOQ97559.1 ATP-binding protein [Anaerolineae bacterium]HPL29904.1 ATP-binding protein [Anaerolineae bacterium]